MFNLKFKEINHCNVQQLISYKFLQKKTTVSCAPRPTFEFIPAGIYMYSAMRYYIIYITYLHRRKRFLRISSLLSKYSVLMIFDILYVHSIIHSTFNIMHFDCYIVLQSYYDEISRVIITRYYIIYIIIQYCIYYEYYNIYSA